MTPVLAEERAVSAAPREPQVRGGAPVASPARLGRRELRASLLLALCCLLVYNANGRSISAGDTYPARYLPFAIWHHHTVFLDPIAAVAAQGRGDKAFWMIPVPGGHVISLYPVVLPVLLAPLYLPAVAYLHHQGWTDGRLDFVARVMEKLVASLLAALSAALLYLLLRRRVAAPAAGLLALAYALGTTTWVVASQALWQHGMAEVLVVGVLLLLTGPCTAPRAAAAGLLLGLIAGNRPPDVVLAAALGAYGLFWAGRRRAALLAAAAALPAGLVLCYNLGVAHHVLGGYGRIGKPRFLQHDLLPGLAGLLLSPTRGLLVFSPFLAFLALAWRVPRRDRGERLLTLAMAAGVLVQLGLYAKADWRGGSSWGPRYMTDLLPLLVWMLAPVVASLRGAGRACFVAAVGVAVAIEAVGAFCYTGVTDAPLVASPRGPLPLQALWDWRNAPFVASLGQGLAPADLMTEVRGSLDALEAGGHAVSGVTAGQDVVAVGWALAGPATPRRVAVLVDGRPAGDAQSFQDRPDVRRTLGEASPAGWRIPFSTAGLAPGQHRLAVFAATSEVGVGHYLAERTLVVRPAESPDEGDLDQDFRAAAARIREHQQEPGYWLTAHTKGARFEAPRPEMNTFLTSLLVDLLDPLADAAGLGDSVQRARRHLTAQIEANGLVRYHGLPDGPGIGTLGCAITPDADDTALVWRIAPPADRRRLPEALATLDRYRTREGLYRTWLAPREAYRCLDPGSDPDPADVAIQMHVLLLLARERPAAARDLCTALRPAVGQDRTWVYYRQTPLVPILRLPDLRRAGCELTLPVARTRTAVPGQEVWVSAVRLLARTSPASPAEEAEALALLRRLAREGFALVRTDPPLLFHNDLTATVPRYYWSEDVGYALWLRLYDDYAHHLGLPRPGAPLHG